MFFSKFRDQKSCVPEASLLDCLQMESAFFGTRRAAGLLQQFRRLSFCLRTLYADDTHLLYKNSWATHHTCSCPAALFDARGVSFHLGALLRRRKLHNTCFRTCPKARLFRCGFPIEAADAGLQWEPCDKILAALFRRVSTLVVGMQLSRYNRGRIKLLTFLIIYSRLNFENIILLVA